MPYALVPVLVMAFAAGAAHGEPVGARVLDSSPCPHLELFLMYGPAGQRTCATQGMVPHLEEHGHIYANPLTGGFVDCGEDVLMVGRSGVRGCIMPDLVPRMQRAGWSIAQGAPGGVISHGTDCGTDVAMMTQGGSITCASPDFADELEAEGMVRVNGTITHEARASWMPPREQIERGTSPGDVQCPEGRILVASPPRTPKCVAAELLPLLERRGYVPPPGTEVPAPGAPEPPPPPPAPMQQLRDGAKLEHIRCAEGRTLAASPSQRPACVTAGLLPLLEGRGYEVVAQEEPPPPPDVVIKAAKYIVHPKGDVRIPQDVVFGSAIQFEGDNAEVAARIIAHAGDRLVKERMDGGTSIKKTEDGRLVFNNHPGNGFEYTRNFPYWELSSLTDDRHDFFFGLIDILGIELSGDEVFSDSAARFPLISVMQRNGDGAEVRNNFLELRFFDDWSLIRMGKWSYDLDQMEVIGHGEARKAAMEYLMSDGVQEAILAECDVHYVDRDFGGLSSLYDRPVYKFDGGDCREYKDRDKWRDPEKHYPGWDFVSETIEEGSRLEDGERVIREWNDGRYGVCSMVPPDDLFVPDDCAGITLTGGYLYYSCHGDYVESCRFLYPETDYPEHSYEVFVDAITGEPLMVQRYGRGA